MKNFLDNYKHLLYLLLAFVLGGFIHVAFHGTDFSFAATQIFYVAVVIFWGMIIRKRIIDYRLRRLMLCISLMIIFYQTLQTTKYIFSTGDIKMGIILWYLYYVPMVFLPTLLFCVAIYMNKDESESPGRKLRLIFIPPTLISIGFLTNNFHRLAFRFKDEISGKSGMYTYGILFYSYVVWQISILLISAIIIFKKCSIPMIRKKIWLPIMVLALGNILLLLFVIGMSPSVNGINIWESTEVFIFMILFFLESFVQIGMIPANRGYERLFAKIRIPAMISDNEGKETLVAGSKLQWQKNALDSNFRIETVPIYGGSVSWEMDFSEINRLNSEIENATKQIESRNEYLRSLINFKEEQERIYARNRLYDNIAKIVSPQLQLIQTFLDNSDDESFDENLAKITVLNAFIKRRSNLELLKEDSDKMSVQELSTAIRESMEYIKLCKVETNVSSFSTENFDAGMIILAYDFFEYVVENALDTLSAIAVVISAQKGVLTLRIILQADMFEYSGNWKASEVSACKGEIRVTTQDRDVVAVMTLREVTDNDLC